MENYFENNPFVDDWYEARSHPDDENNEIHLDYGAYLLKLVLDTEAAPDDEKRWTGYLLQWDARRENYHPVHVGPFTVHAATLQEAKSELLGLFITYAEKIVAGLEKSLKEWHKDIELMKAARIRTQMGAA